MKITVLLENATPSSRFIAKHGLSLLLDAATAAGPCRILFDVGPDESMLANARALGVDVAAVDAVVLSHGHADHGGGLAAYLEATSAADRRAPIYVRADAFVPHASGVVAQRHAIGLDGALAMHPRLVKTDTLNVLAPGLALFSDVARAHAEPSSNSRLFEEREGCWQPDHFAHEQSLLVQEGKHTVLIAGCAHAGILNIMDRAEKLAGRPLDAVVGGFHLMSPSAGTVEDPEAVRALAHELGRRGARYYTFHCTGLAAYSILRDELGDRVQYLCCGSSVEV